MIYGTFDNIKVGDKVIYVHCGTLAHKMRITKVTKVNKASFEIEDGLYLYRKTDGRKRGDVYSRSQIYPYNEKNVDEYNQWFAENKVRERRNFLLNKITKSPFKDFSNEVLEDIWTTISKYPQ